MKSNKESKLVAFIKNERVKARISQEMMALSLGISRRCYQRMEKESMPVWILEEVCERLGFRGIILNKEVLK